MTSKPESEVRLVLDTLEALRGYQSPNYGAEGKAIKWMLGQGYLPTQIIGCYTHLKMDKFWADKIVTMMKVRTEIGEWVPSQREYVDDYHGARGTSFEAHKADYEWRWGKQPDDPAP